MKKRLMEFGVLLLLIVSMNGCVTRELVITSEPSGAKVLIDETYSGTTPMLHRFTHYQVFGIRLEAEGYQPVYAEERVSPPFYEQPGVDFISEVGPWNFHDRREFHYKLAKVEATDNVDTVLQHAEAARDRIHQTAKEQAIKDKERLDRLEKTHRFNPLPLNKRVKEAEESKQESKAGLPESVPASGTPVAEEEGTDPVPGAQTEDEDIPAKLLE